jgi:hypothetical protein
LPLIITFPIITSLNFKNSELGGHVESVGSVYGKAKLLVIDKVSKNKNGE